MKVICISNTAKKHPDCVGSFMVKEGSVYIVKGEFDIEEEHFYQFEEDVAGNGWNSIYFIPLSDFDEKLLVCLRTKPLRKIKTNESNNSRK